MNVKDVCNKDYKILMKWIKEDTYTHKAEWYPIL
jgi:hypothetical protein